MDTFLNSVIERSIPKPITAFQRELIKGFIFIIIGLFISIFLKKMNTDLGAREDFMYYFAIAVYPLGFYYGFGSAKNFLLGSGTESSNDLYVAIALKVTLIVIAFVIAWIAGIFRYIKLLIRYKRQEAK